MGVCNCSMFCCTLLYVHSSIAIILMGKRELVALLNLSSWCLVMVERLFLAVLRGCLRFVIVAFPDHTHYFCVCLLLIFLLFTLRYLIIELKINLLILLKEPFREKALLTLHVMTEMRFLLRKNQIKIMHGHAKMYVMC